MQLKKRLLIMTSALLFTIPILGISCSANSNKINDEKEYFAGRPFLEEDGINGFSKISPNQVIGNTSNLVFPELKKHIFNFLSKLSEKDKEQLKGFKTITKAKNASSILASKINKTNYRSYIDFEKVAPNLDKKAGYSLETYFSPLVNLATNYLQIELALKKDNKIIKRLSPLVITGFKKEPKTKKVDITKLSQTEFLKYYKNQYEKSMLANKYKKDFIQSAPSWCFENKYLNIFKLLNIDWRKNLINPKSIKFYLSDFLESLNPKIVIGAEFWNVSLAYKKEFIKYQINTFWVNKGLFDKDGNYQKDFEIPIIKLDASGNPLVDNSNQIVISDWGSVFDKNYKKEFVFLVQELANETKKLKGFYFSMPIDFKSVFNQDLKPILKADKEIPKTLEEANEFNTKKNRLEKLDYFYFLDKKNIQEYYWSVDFDFKNKTFIFDPLYSKIQITRKNKLVSFYQINKKLDIPYLFIRA